MADSQPLARSLNSSRLLPLDALRGFIMVVMALDHANALVAQGKLAPELWAGSFPNYDGNALLFLTRFVTHLAAPGFFFLMGAGTVLFAISRRAGWGRWRIVRHFVLRGAVLILLQLTLENAVWSLGEPIGATFFGVLYALGGAMVLGSLLLFVPTPLLIGGGIFLISATELLLPASRNSFAEVMPGLRLWLIPGYTRGMYVLYPLMPWLGVAALGMAYGRWLHHNPQTAYRLAVWGGSAALLVFAVVRLLNGYGNIRPMSGGDWISFLNVVKYPPSITFLLLTLGINGLLLGALAAWNGRAFSGLVVFGRVPLFFYLTHLCLYALMGMWLSPEGMPVARMYPFWLLGLVILWPLCWAYGRFKQSRSVDSLWRLL